MKRTRRIIAIFEMLEACGARGLTREEIRQRLSERGVAVEMRQLERDLAAMRTDLDFPIHSSFDVTDDQAAAGARVVYFFDRVGRESRALLSSGKSMAWLEYAGGVIAGKPIERGDVMLHHERGTVSARDLARKFPGTRLLYLGQHHFIHFYLEVSPQVGFDVEVRIGRINKVSEVKGATEREVLIGLAGFPIMSRLSGPKRGHVQLTFPASSQDVIATDLSAAGVGALRMHPSEAAPDKTPIVSVTQGETRRFVLRESGQLSFGGALLHVLRPPA